MYDTMVQLSELMQHPRKIQLIGRGCAMSNGSKIVLVTNQASRLEMSFLDHGTSARSVVLDDSTSLAQLAEDIDAFLGR